MTNKKAVSTYERIILFKRMPYWLYWALMGLAVFLINKAANLILHERQFLFTEIVFSGAIGLLPTLMIFGSHEFEKTMVGLSSILWGGNNNNEEFNQWLYERKTRIFTLKSWGAKFITILFVACALLTISFLGLPFQSSIANGLALLGFISLLLMSGQTAYLLLDLLITLREIVYRPVNIPFYIQTHPAIKKLQSIYFSAALFTTLGYVLGVLSIWQSPYGFSFELQLWLTMLAFYPISMFFWSFFHVHILMQNIKDSHIKIINQEIQRTLGVVLKNEKTDDVERLEKMMGIQNKVQEVKEYPIELQGALTFIATFATVLVQIIISVRELLKP